MKKAIVLTVITISLVSCYKDKDYLPSSSDYSNSLTISSSETAVLADGESSTYIILEEPIDIKEDYTSVSLSTSKGKFENGLQTITKSIPLIVENGINKRKALVKLTSTIKIETAEVKASITNINKTININFIRAFPDSIKTSTSSLTIAPGFSNIITLTTSIFRITGKPTTATPISLKVIDNLNNPIGYYLNYLGTSDDNGTATNKYTLGDQNYHGVLRAISSSVNGLNHNISDTIQIISP